MKRYLYGALLALIAFVAPVAASASAYSSAILGYSPVVYYRMDDPTGTSFADTSGHGWNATLVGAATFGQPGLVAGDSDTAVAFNGGHGTIPSAAGTASSFTMLAIVKASSYAYGGNGASVLDYHGQSMTIVGSRLEWCFDFFSTCGGGAAPVALVANQTYFLAITANPTGGQLFCSVNGSTLGNCDTHRYGSSTLLQPYYYIDLSSFQSSFVGVVDEVAVIPTILTQPQISALALLAGSSTQPSQNFLGSW